MNDRELDDDRDDDEDLDADADADGTYADADDTYADADADYDDDDEDDDDDHEDADDEYGAEGNRIVGGVARAVVEHIARSVADEPGAIDVELTERGRNEVALSVHTAPDDMGRLIGRRGRVIQAVRQVARAAGAVEGVKATVDVAE